MIAMLRIGRWMPVFWGIASLFFPMELMGQDKIGPQGPRSSQYQPHAVIIEPKVPDKVEQGYYLNIIKNTWKDSSGDGVDKNEKLNDKIMYLWQHMNMLDTFIRMSARGFAKDLSPLYDKHMSTLRDSAAGTLSWDPGRFELSRLPNPAQKYSTVSGRFSPTYYATYDDKGKGQGTKFTFSILNINPPKATFNDAVSSPVSAAFHRGDNGRLVRKVVHVPYFIRRVSAAQNSPAQKGMEKIVNGIAQELLPEQMLTTFNARNTVNRLLTQAGIVRAANGIIARPSVPQDYAFVHYANIGCSSKNEALFWSDPMVLSGYDQALGTALNGTSLKGYREMDMDDIISRGYSSKIDRENMLRRPEDRMVNPFRGYAAKVVPGLVEMARQGRLTAGESATDEQLREAMKLTKKLALLPSQNKEAWIPKPATASVQYSCRAMEGDLAFTPPPRAFLAGQVSGSGTVTVPLNDGDEINYIQRLQLAKTRLAELQVLIKANEDGRAYVQKIIESYGIMFYAVDQMKEEFMSKVWNDAGGNLLLAAGEVTEPTPLCAIPHFTMMEKHITTSAEQCRAMLSQLAHQRDDLKQNEWKVIQHILDARREAIEILMSNAAMKYANFKWKQAYK